MADARRPHGTGSVYQEHTPDCPPAEPVVDPKTGKTKKVRPKHACTGRWVGSIESGWTKNGTRRRRRVVGRTERDVKAKIRAALSKAEEAEAPIVGGKPTVKRWADVWLENTETTLRPTTWSANRTAVTQWIVPTIGHRRLDQLAPGDIRTFHRAMEAKPLAPASQSRYHAALSRMLSAAIEEGYNVPERARMVEGPGTGTNDRNALPLDDALAILEVASKRPDASRWAAALLQGMRPAEALGLTWDMVDLDEDDPTITLAWQLKPLPYRKRYDRESGFRVPKGFEARQVDGALHLVRPKTKSGWRVIPLVPWMVASLTAWREVAPESRHRLVWPQTDGMPQRDDDDRATWYRITDAAQVAVIDPSPRQDGPEMVGRRPELYEARHTTATLLKVAGVDDETITAIMGHASILSTKAYLHTDRTRARAALVGVAGRLGLTAS